MVRLRSLGRHTARRYVNRDCLHFAYSCLHRRLSKIAVSRRLKLGLWKQKLGQRSCGASIEFACSCSVATNYRKCRVRSVSGLTFANPLSPHARAEKMSNAMHGKETGRNRKQTERNGTDEATK